MIFSMPTQRDEHVRHGEAHAAVAFRFDDADAARFGDQEIRAADADFNAKELLAQVASGRVGESSGSSPRFGRCICRERSHASGCG